MSRLSLGANMGWGLGTDACGVAVSSIVLGLQHCPFPTGLSEPLIQHLEILAQ